MFRSRLALVVGIAIAASLSSLAAAADLPVKAPSKNSLLNGYPYGGSGFYFGINTIGGGGSVEASGPGVNPNSITTNSAAVGLTVGYTYANPSGSVFYAVEAMFDIQNFNGNAPGFAFSGPAAFEQRLKIGTPLNNFLSMFPTLGLPTVPPMPALPNGVVATNIHPYFMIGLHEDDISLNYGLAGNRAWRVAPAIGVGSLGQLTNGVAVDVWAEVINKKNEQCIGGVVCAKVGTEFKAGLALLY